ncbi:MAG: hypothetical protein ACOX3R_14410 [Desulfitobacteriia bacterium]
MKSLGINGFLNNIITLARIGIKGLEAAVEETSLVCSGFPYGRYNHGCYGHDHDRGCNHSYN